MRDSSVTCSLFHTTLRGEKGPSSSSGMYTPQRGPVLKESFESRGIFSEGIFPESIFLEGIDMGMVWEAMTQFGFFFQLRIISLKKDPKVHKLVIIS